MKRYALFALVAWPLLTAGMCTSTREPNVVIREVMVPVHTPCAVEPPPIPDFADTDEKLRDLHGVELVRAFAIGRLQHYEYEAKLRAHDTACSS